MFSLLYRSDAVRDMTREDLDAITTVSVARNHALNVTGFLVYFDRTFIQILEGDEEKVRRLYERVLRDKRHENIVLLNANAPLYRESPFDCWAMNYMMLDPEDFSRRFLEAPMSRAEFKKNTYDFFFALRVVARAYAYWAAHREAARDLVGA